ncbi:protein bark beetle-like [Antedon mediterranea]|uniref:protein bark beetle-like n=1 Tax=Antedon mediterranea TaxID=105859 RepID=UPI003AF7B76F
MKRIPRIIIVCLLAGFVTSGFSSTISSFEELGGKLTQNTTLNDSSSAYTVSNTLEILRNVTLTIEPGCRLQFQNGTGISVRGSLVVLGTTENRVVFEPIESVSAASKHKTVAADIKLKGGASPNEGRLEMYLDDGRWASVCSASWDDVVDSSLACRLLGYTAGVMHPVVIDDDEYWLDTENDWLADFNCYGNETSFRDCATESKDYGSYYVFDNNECDGRSIVNLKCEGGTERHYNNATWTGITWDHADYDEYLQDGVKSFKSKSYLQNLDVFGAGVTGDFHRRPAIESYGIPPSFNSVQVKYSFGDGIDIKDAPSEVEIMDSIFSDNYGLGLLVSTAAAGNVLIQTSEISRNGLGGLNLGYKPTSNPSNILKTYDDLCSINSGDSYPVYIESESGRDCTTVFSAPGDQKLHLRIYKRFGYLIQLRDGDNSTAPIIATTFSAEIHVVSTGSSLWVRAKHLGFGKSLQILITVYKEAAKTFELKDVYVHSNQFAGMTAALGSSSISISNSFFLDNELDGVKIQDADDISIESVAADRNKLSGIAILTENADVSITNCSLNYNDIGLFCQRTFRIQNGKMTVSLTESTIRDNNKQGILLDSSEMIMDVRDNYIAENSHGGLVIVTYKPISTMLSVVRNVFEDNSHVSIDTGKADITKIHIENNFMSAAASFSSESLIASNYSNCPGCYLRIVNNTLHSSLAEVAVHIEASESGGSASISNNVFQNITCRHVIKISSETDSPPNFGLVSIQENNFIDNSPLLKEGENRETSSLLLAVSNVFLRHNFFLDVFEVKLIVQYTDPTAIIPAQLNWWGFDDENMIKKSIIDKLDHMNLASVDYFPYLLSANKSDVVKDRVVDNSTFIRNGNVLGGLMTMNVTLEAQPDPFVVDKHVIVCHDCVLKLEPGVRIKFNPYTGIQVYGRIDLSGDIGNQIELSLNVLSETVEKSTYRLAVGSDSSEGILLENQKGSWQPSCVANDDEILQNICKDLGYQGMMEYEYLEDGPDGVKHTVCPNTNINCNPSAAGLSKPCKSGSQVYLKCVPIKWAGIRLFTNAMPSTMNNVAIRDAGSHFDGVFQIVPAVQVDYYRHSINNIIISDSQAGLMVLTSDPFSTVGQPTNVSVHGCHDEMYSIKAIFPPLILSNITVRDCSRGVLFEGFSSTKLIEYNEKMIATVSQHQCFGNISLSRNGIVYFSLENGMSENRQLCEDTIYTDDDLVIGVHLVRASLLKDESFAVYDGIESNAEELITVTENNQGTYAFISKGSTIVLRFTSGLEPLDVGQLVVVIRALPADSIVSSQEVSQFWLSNFDFDLSGDESGSGVEVNNLERHHSLNISQSTMRLNGIANGMTIQGYGSVTIMDVVISDVGTGIQMDSFAGEFTMTDSDLIASEVGIEIAGRYTSGETTHIITRVSFSRITNSSSSAIHVRDEQKLKKVLNIKGCNFTGNYVTVRLTGCNETVFIEDVIILQSMRGIEMNDFSGSIYVNNSFISARDRALDASSTTPFLSNVFGYIGNTYFTGHTYLVMHLREFSTAQSVKRTRNWSIVNCTFYKNANVIKLDTAAFAERRQSLLVSRCTFKQNEGTLIHLMDGSVEANLVGNSFIGNEGSAIQTGILRSQSILNILKNVFINNVAGIDDFVRISGDITTVQISNNQFIGNVGHSLIYVIDRRQIHRSKILSESLIVTFNNITSNKPDSKHPGEMSCAIKIDVPRGTVTHNVLNNDEFLLEICSNALLFDESVDFINATYNWWGVIDDDVIENRIVDIGDRNDIVSIEHSPFLTSNDVYGKDNFMDSSLSLDVNNRVSGGKIKGEVKLTLGQSPYEIKSDITVLQGSILTIEAGVVLQFHPNIGMLVLGDLVAEGEENNVIKMESIRSKMKNSPTLQLSGGKTPAEGRLEILIDNKWTRICRQSWTMAEATVACGQMGYAPPARKQWSTNTFKESTSDISNTTFSCRGNELDLNDCSMNSTLCIDDFDVGLMCVTSSETQMRLAWGGLRIMETSVVQKTGTLVRTFKDKTVILRYVDIYDAGHLHNNDVAAISLSHTSPIIEDVRVLNSVSIGIEILTPLQPFSMERVLVNNSASHGITLTRGTDVIDVAFDSIELLGNDIGLQIVDFTGGLYANEYVGLHDICSMNDVTVNDYLMGYFDRYSESNSECTVIIRSADTGTRLNVAVRRLRFTPGKDTLTFYEGSEYDGVVLGQFSQSSTNDILTLESKSDTITLKMLYSAGSFERYYLFEITTKIEGELSHIISTSTIAHSKRAGILYTGLSTSLEMSQCRVNNNNQDELSPNKNAAVHVIMNGGNLNISQCIFEHNAVGALSVDIGRSNEVKAKQMSIHVTNSEFASNIGVCIINVSSHFEAQIDKVNTLISGNIVENNTAAVDSSVIAISGVQLIFEENLVKENIGKTLDWTGIKSNDNLVMFKNSFFFNNARSGPTISINGKGSQFFLMQNSFTDLNNFVEIEAVFDDNTNKRLNAAHNWWGMTSPELIATRVETDNGENQGNIEIVTKPSLQTPASTVYDFDCPIGFTKIGLYCYQLRNSVRNYSEAVKTCNKLSAVITNTDYIDLNAVKHLMMSKESPDIVWLYKDSYQTKSKLDQDCKSYDPVTNSTSVEACNQWLSFVCKTFTVGMCHVPESHSNTADDEDGSGNDLFTCEEVSSCSMRGRCIAPNLCHCYVGFQGKSCRNNAPSNERPPLFTGVQNLISIAKKSPKGTFVAHLKATDINYETNEQFCFYLVPNKVSEKVHLNSNSGMIHLKFDASKLMEHSSELLVSARDEGSPPKSSMTSILITILDNAPNCPVFSAESSFIVLYVSPKPSQDVYIRAVVANSKTIYYSLYQHSAAKGITFRIGELSGLLTPSDVLAVGVYSFVVTAYTTGEGSCISGMTVMVEVHSSEKETVMFTSSTYRPSEGVSSTRTPTLEAVEHPNDCETLGCVNGGSCVNKICICSCPYAGDFCKIESHCIEMTMKVERMSGQPALYDLRLGDNSDPLFLTYAEKVHDFVESAIYTNDILAQSYTGNTVTEFSEGSLMVDYHVTFHKKSLLTYTELQSVLITALSEYDGDGSLTIDSTTITTSESDGNNVDTTKHDAGDGVDIGGGIIAIIAIICVGVIIVIIVAIVLLIRRKQKRRSYYNNLRGHPIQMTNVKRQANTQDGEEVTYRGRSASLETSPSEERL